MKHPEANELLSDYLVGRLRPGESSGVEQHLAVCAECRDQARIYTLFAESLCPEGSSGEGHPTSHELAAWAVDPVSQRDSIEEHVGECLACEHQAELSRQALAAGDAEPIAERGIFGVFVGKHQGGLALAASLILLVAAWSWTSGRDLQVPSHRTATGSVSGSRIITAVDSILVIGMKIESGSEVVFRAGEVISFGEDFVVGSGATLLVETTGSPDAARQQRRQ